jgi:hypothetical protein
LGRVRAKVLRAVGTARASGMGRHSSTHVVRGRGCRAVRGADTRVVLRASPREADTRVSNRVALHLVDCHLGGVTVHKLDKAAALSRRDLDVSDLAEALEERAELVLSDVARQSANKDGGVVRVSELVHGLHGIEGRGLVKVLRHAPVHLTAVATRTTRWDHGVGSMTAMATGILVGASILLEPVRTWDEEGNVPSLGRSSGDTHRAVAAVDTLHLNQGTLLVALLTKANEAVATRLASHGVGHDLRRFARRETRLEKRNKDEFVHLRAKVTHKDAVLGATIVTVTDC